MAWEQRGASRYYYRSVRDPGGRVRRLYLGSEHSPAAQSAALEDEERRATLAPVRELPALRQTREQPACTGSPP